jgi:hypothetical protein
MIVPKGGTTYEVQGTGFTGVGAFDALVSYDPATLGSPQVTQGALASGTLFVANPKYAPGQIRLAFIRDPGVTGTGAVATITFVPVGGGERKVPSVAATLLDTNGKPLSGGSAPPTGSSGSLTTGSLTTPAATGASADKTVATTGDTGKSTTGIANWPGTITLGGETGTTSEPSRPAPVEPPPAQPPAAEPEPRTVPVAEAAPAKAPERLVLPAPPANVLERFRTYKGERTVAALQPLFSRRGGSWIQQEPAIARADGKTPLTVQITLERMGLEAPNFALRNLELKGLKPVGESGWSVEGVPKAGAYQATVSMLLGEAAADIPLVVLPPLPAEWAGKKLTEALVNRFLAERGTDKSPQGDLNGDGRRDYRDDYIMIGNYLQAAPAVTAPEAQKSAPAKAGSGKERAPARQ